MRVASAGLEGATAPTVFQLRKNSWRKESAAMRADGRRVDGARERFSLSAIQALMPALTRILTLLPILALCSCQAGPTYKITLKDGREYLCQGVPQFQKKTGYYRYRTLQDRDAMLRADEIFAIEEQG
ncbi:MAG TPA: hypothetical protein DIT64_02440 [Verrucomicrobiales bacterium]|nr:hypothetical protein [Verrucomicrobiales bacterium]